MNLTCGICGYDNHNLYFSNEFFKTQRHDLIHLCCDCEITLNGIHLTAQLLFDHKDTSETIRYMIEEWDGEMIAEGDYENKHVRNRMPHEVLTYLLEL